MKNEFRHLPKDERKKILLLCDDIRLHSGIGTMGREIVVNTSQHFNWFNVGASLKHPEKGKILDLSEEVNRLTGLEDADVKVMPNDGYGSPDLIRVLLEREKPDAIFIFTDPRYWIWLFEMEREIRTRIPIFYLNIWDDFPAPMYNRPYYESVDLLMAISKQTKFINENVLGEQAKEKVIKYVPHGIEESIFFPIDQSYDKYKEYLDFKKNIFQGKDIEFVAFYNSRNIRRKSTADLILAYRLFCDEIGKEAAKKCALVLHTELVSDHGTDLKAVKDALTDPSYVNIFFSTDKLTSEQMNLLYNLADVTVLPSSNEGWGLSLTESMLAGTMIIANTTGGMQDQMRFVDDNGDWYTPSSDIPSNHRGTYKRCGKWAVPVFPGSTALQGSPLTPYIYDDKANPLDIATAIKLVWELDPEERKQRGLAGREWAMSDEAGMTATKMGNNVIEACDEAFEKFIPRSDYDLILVDGKPDRYVKHKLAGY